MHLPSFHAPGPWTTIRGMFNYLLTYPPGAGAARLRPGPGRVRSRPRLDLAYSNARGRDPRATFLIIDRDGDPPIRRAASVRDRVMTYDWRPSVPAECVVCVAPGVKPFNLESSVASVSRQARSRFSGLRSRSQGCPRDGGTRGPPATGHAAAARGCPGPTRPWFRAFWLSSSTTFYIVSDQHAENRTSRIILFS